MVPVMKRWIGINFQISDFGFWNLGLFFELNKDLRSMKRMENCGYGSSNKEMDWD